VRVIIAGSRTIKDYSLIRKVIDDSGFDITTIISGCAAGPDTLGIRYAREYNIDLEEYPADWAKYGKSAGPIRNQVMANEADALILVWDGKSHGSKNMLDTMKKMNKPTYELVIKNLVS
jgi:hypothetical protein